MNEQELLAMLVAAMQEKEAKAKETTVKLTRRCLACIKGGKGNQVSLTVTGTEGLPTGQIAVTVAGKEFILTSDGSNSLYVTKNRRTQQGFNALVLELYKAEENADGEKVMKVDSIKSTSAQIAAVAAAKASPLSSM